ncbi:hypothetical protein [Streptomyces stelliscabiei]|uniref:hypothetical protein n=1 Tax=Streptomyces stelliscabiei TaxID=146820 RepID=UPI0029B2A71B|nr:hypothetical protein [Streptomyces stelliscabiei]MDX2550144.1 hypothetical protein [Streptomyces stelliscabiei]
MSALPERYQRYAQPGPRPVYPAEVELYSERQPAAREPSVWVESADDPNLMVRIPKRYVETTLRSEPRDLTPLPLIDPLAARMAGAGIGSGAAGAGIGWGIGQAAAGVAAFGGTTAVVVMLALWLLARAGRPSVHVRQEVHNHARWFGKNHTNL